MLTYTLLLLLPSHMQLSITIPVIYRASNKWSAQHNSYFLNVCTYLPVTVLQPYSTKLFLFQEIDMVCKVVK